MSDDKGINTGPNSRPLNDTIAGTGPGLPDDALAPGEEMPTAPSDEADRRGRRGSSTRTRGAGAGRRAAGEQ